MFTSSAQKIASKTSEWLENTLFGRSKDENATLETAKIDENSIPDGFSIIDTTSSPQNSNLWITLQRVKDIALGKLESISLYAVENGRITALVKENVGITDVLRLNLGNYSSFALVRDSGLRSRIEELGNVVLSGLMPKNGVAEATDVTEEYENFLGGRSVSKEGEADEDLGGQSSDKEGEAVHTIAAFDITITNDGEEYQPEGNPVSVSIQDEEIATAVANGNSIELWHVLDDGSAEKVEHFTIDGDTVSFSASGFSVYVVTETTVEKILTAADGSVYKITVTYDGSAQIPEGAELVVTEVAEDQYLASTATALGVDESYLLYRKFLDISFIDADGAVVEPESPVSVKIELLDVEAGAEKLQVVHFGEMGAEKVTATSNENAVVTFSSDEFSVYGFGNVLEALASTETETTSVEILGFESGTQLASTDAPEVEEGLEVLASYSVDKTNGFVPGTINGTTAVSADSYYTFNLTISKTMTGDNAMNTHEFPFSVDFTNAAVTKAVTLGATTSGTVTDYTHNAVAASSLDGIAKLANGGSIKYIGIPCGTSVTVFETNDVTGTTYQAIVTTDGTVGTAKNITWGNAPAAKNSEEVTDNSSAAYESNVGTVTTTADTVDNTTGRHTIAIANTLELISPTGYVSRFAPYALILVAGIVLLIVAKKRRPAEEEE